MLESLLAAMMEPAFYPKPPASVTHSETHISHLFFAGDLVYKIKKAVQFSFLDFSTLAKRRHYLQEELRLNRRLAPSVYLGVVPLAFDGLRWQLGGWSKPAEYALVMRRLPEKRMLTFLLETRQANFEMMQDLAKVLAGFHSRAEVARDLSPNSYLSVVKKYWYENLAEWEPFIPDSERKGLQAIKEFGADFFERCHDLLTQRAAEGWVRDVHGDLHAEHICFAPEGIEIFDCIEFSNELRCCDLASEIGFLVMDLCVRDGEALAEKLLAEYLSLMKDSELPKLLPFFACYRALVRAKVHALRLAGWNDETARYLRFARRFTWDPLKPFLVMVCGLTGSGKSTLARELAERLGLPAVNSDIVRKQIASKVGRETAPLNQGIYSSAMTEKTYAKLLRHAEKQIRAGKGAILDATFTRREAREKIIRLAEKYRIPLAVIHCSAPGAIIGQRLHQRALAGTDISDGRWEIYIAQKAADEPIEEIPREDWLELNTDTALDEQVIACENFLRTHLAR